MPSYVVIDTNVLLHDPLAIFRFAGSHVCVPMEVVEELDAFKHDPGELGRSSRPVAQILDELRSRGSLGDGVACDRGATFRILCEGPDRHLLPDGFGQGRDNRVANSLLCAALRLRQREADARVEVITKNVNLRVKADALGIRARDYDVDRVPDSDRATGWHRIDVPAPPVHQLLSGEPLRLQGFDACPNEYITLQQEDDPGVVALGRFDHRGDVIRPLEGADRSLVGIRSLNTEQTFAVDGLLDDDIKLITLTGKAGTGKTLLAIAAALHKVFAEDLYYRMLVFRPTMPVSRDLGFLPGDVEEKMRPWMQPVYDALELIRDKDRRSTTRTLPVDILECEEISVEPLTYIRGRSIPNQFIIIDEAQNLTPLEVKTVITRVGSGTKIVFTGDPHQIDNPYVDAQTNGLTFLVGKFRESHLAAHVSLVKGERSRLAETAANLL